MEGRSSISLSSTPLITASISIIQGCIVTSDLLDSWLQARTTQFRGCSDKESGSPLSEIRNEGLCGADRSHHIAIGMLIGALFVR